MEFKKMMKYVMTVHDMIDEDAITIVWEYFLHGIVIYQFGHQCVSLFVEME